MLEIRVKRHFLRHRDKEKECSILPQLPSKNPPFFYTAKVAKMTQPGPKSMHNFPAKTPILPHRACFARIPSSPVFSPFFPPFSQPLSPFFAPFSLFFPLFCLFFMQPKRKMKKQFLKSLKQLFHPKGLFGTVLSQYRTILGGRVGSFNRGKGAVILAPVW